MVLHVNLIQVYSLNVIKPRFPHLFIGKLFWTGKTSCYDDLNTFSHCLFISGTLRNSSWRKPMFTFHSFPKNINYVSQLFNDNGSIKNGMTLVRIQITWEFLLPMATFLLYSGTISYYVIPKWPKSPSPHLWTFKNLHQPLPLPSPPPLCHPTLQK